MNCDEAEELLGAYALDALPTSEAAAMRAHLDGCAQHAAKAAELRAVALQMHELAEPIDAPVRLRGRVLDAIAREATVGAAAPRSISGAPSRNRVQWGPANMRFVGSNAWGAIAAALVIAVGGLLAWNLVLQNRDSAGVDQFALARAVPLSAPTDGKVSGTVIYARDEKKAIVVTFGLPSLDTPKTYQMWALGDGNNPKSIGLMQPDASGHATTVVDFDGSRTSEIAITIEPAGGSAQPTSNPILTASCVAAPATNCTTY